MLSSLTLEIAEPFKIVVENLLNTISPYILLEQETWFEADVPFLKAFLKPGMRVVDIGTNCGFYTLLAAHLVGETGHVWGFEPGLKPARLLKESLKLNGFTNVTLYEAAAGPKGGTTWFSDYEQTELSAVVSSDTSGAREVRVESLDELYAAGQLREIDFIKIDAEGFEDQVILGGKTFFAVESPLVMLEVTADASPADMGPAGMLQAEGYRLYRYSVGGKCLVPLVTGKPGDYLLNIFLCKPDREKSLAALNLLVAQEDIRNDYAPADPKLFFDYFHDLPVVKTCSWLLAAVAQNQITDDSGYNTMCAELLMSENSALSAAERVVRLMRAEAWIDGNFKENMPFGKVISFLRIWKATGRITLIGGLLKVFSDGQMPVPLTVEHPFLAVSAQWDAIPAHDGSFYSWLSSMLIEEYERRRSFSSLYVSSGIRATYTIMEKAGYLTEEIERRAALATLIRGFEQFPVPSFIPDKALRNKEIWQEITDRLAKGEKEVTSLTIGRDLS